MLEVPGTPRPTASQYRGGTGDECSFGCGPLAHAMSDMGHAIVSTYVRRFGYFVLQCSDALPSLKLPSRNVGTKAWYLHSCSPRTERSVTGTTADRKFLPPCPTTSPISVLEAARKVHLDIHHPALASSAWRPML
jgi:hypothetical protein